MGATGRSSAPEGPQRRRHRVAGARLEVHAQARAGRGHGPDLGQRGERRLDRIPLAARHLEGLLVEPGQQRGRLPLEEQPPPEGEPDPVAALGLVHVGSGDEHRHPRLDELVEERPELAPRDRVDAVGGLVEEQHPGLVEERGGQRQLLVHAPGELVGAPVHEALEPRDGEQPLGPLPEDVARQDVEAREELEVLHDREVPVEAVLLRQEPERLADLAARPRVHPEHAGLPGVEVDEPGQRADGGGLAGPVGADEPVELPGPDREGHPGERLDLAEALLHAARLEGRLHHFSRGSVTCTGIPGRSSPSGLATRTSTG